LHRKAIPSLLLLGNHYVLGSIDKYELLIGLEGFPAGCPGPLHGAFIRNVRFSTTLNDSINVNIIDEDDINYDIELQAIIHIRQLSEPIVFIFINE